MEHAKIERGADFDLFSATAGCQSVGDKRKASDDECRAYARWLAMRAGIVEAVTNSPKLEWKMTDRRNNVCIGAYFGDAFIAFPGADQNGAVTFELLDESGNVEKAGTIYAKPNGALNIAAADAQAMKESAKAWSKANKGKAKASPIAPPISKAERTANSIALGEQMAAAMNEYRLANPLPPIGEPAPVATVSGELKTAQPKRVRTVSRVIGGMPYGHLQEEHFIVGLGASFEWCEGPLDRWYSQREGRTAAYGEGYATKQEAIDNVDAIIATETPQDAAPAPALAGQSEIEPQDEKNGLPDDAEAQPNPIAALMARMDALEAMLIPAATNEGAEINTTPIAAIESDAPLSGELKPKRTAAHIRAIMAYLELRKERKHNAIGMTQLDAMRADRDDWQKIAEQNAAQIDRLNSLAGICNEHYKMRLDDIAAEQGKRRRAILKALTIRQALKREKDISLDRFRQVIEINRSRSTAWQELASFKAKIADPSNPVRESDMLMLKGNAEAWQAKAIAAIAEGERLKRLALQNAGHIETLASRVAKAETMLRESGALPVLTLVPPTASVAA